jgi:hypothetical protein
MAVKLEADPSIFVAAMGKAVSITNASVTEIKSQLMTVRSEIDRLAGVLDQSVGAGFRAAAGHAMSYYKMHEGLRDMEAEQEKGLVKLKEDLQFQVNTGQLSAAEMKRQIGNQEIEDTNARIEAESQANQELYRGIRDQLIATGIEFVIQEGLKVAAGLLTATAASANEVVKTTAAASGAAARGAITTTETTAEISADAATGATAAIAAHAGIPFVGIGIGLAAAAVIIAAITKYMGYWSEGGYVTGGQKGKDSVPGLLMPGEYVLSVKQVEMWKKLSEQMGTVKPANGSYARGGPVVDAVGFASSGGKPTTVNISFKSNQLPNQAETKRWVRSTLSPALKELGQQGMLAH